MRWVLVWALLVTLVGCDEENDASTRRAEEPSAERPSEVEMVASMEGHYNVVIRAHDALLQGDMERFAAQFALLEQQRMPANSPESWAPHYQRLQVAGRAAKEASDLSAAASTLASVVLACGSCHEALDSGPVYPAPAPTDSDSPTRDAMLDHKWASERLWEGVTGPWDNAWERGTGAMAEVQVFGPEAAEAELSEDLLRRQQELRALGEEGKTTTSPSERAALYGRILATCGGCHQAIGLSFEESD